ncbi:hypothetical protein STTU_4718 [Streptomyces sp. Tu6071]|nr:hypothetical protein STTU_4718 [Streptomyces sp. Tu6071]
MREGRDEFERSLWRECRTPQASVNLERVLHGLRFVPSDAVGQCLCIENGRCVLEAEEGEGIDRSADGSSREGQHLNDGLLGENAVGEVAQLFPQDVWSAHRRMQRGLVNDHPQLQGLRAAQESRALHPSLDEFLDLGVVGGGERARGPEDGVRVPPRLEDARNPRGFEGVYGYGLPFHLEEGKRERGKRPLVLDEFLDDPPEGAVRLQRLVEPLRHVLHRFAPTGLELCDVAGRDEYPLRQIGLCEPGRLPEPSQLLAEVLPREKAEGVAGRDVRHALAPYSPGVKRWLLHNVSGAQEP